MAVVYPSTLPCPLLEGHSYRAGDTFLRSQFDYDIRERPTCTKQYEVGFTFLIEGAATMKAFRDFYYVDCLRGTKIFTADWKIEESEVVKEFRFAAPYTVVALGNNNYKVTAVFDMITNIETL